MRVGDRGVGEADDGRTEGPPAGLTSERAQPVPPEWPGRVGRPGTPEWERTAVAWLLDLVPGEWRAYELLRRHPVVLGRMASRQVAASLEAAREGWRTLRRDLGRQLPPEVVEAAMSTYELEGARLAGLVREVAAVEAALRGQRWVPGAGRWTSS